MSVIKSSDIWMQTLSGEAIDIIKPTADKICLSDIAWSLAAAPRFSGHTQYLGASRFSPIVYSVAQHSLWVCMHLEEMGRGPEIQMAGLLHDAHEAYIGDDSSPKKWAVAKLCGFDVLGAIASGFDRAISEFAGLPYPWPEAWKVAVKASDLAALATERRDLMAPCSRHWVEMPEPHYAPIVDIMSQDIAAHTFMAVYNHLASRIAAERLDGGSRMAGKEVVYLGASK